MAVEREVLSLSGAELVTPIRERSHQIGTTLHLSRQSARKPEPEAVEEDFV